jgi:hypothetical protein
LLIINLIFEYFYGDGDLGLGILFASALSNINNSSKLMNSILEKFSSLSKIIIKFFAAGFPKAFAVQGR